MRLGHTRDPHPFGARGAQDALDVTLGVDDRGHAPVVEEVGAVTQFRSGERNGLDHGNSSLAMGRVWRSRLYTC